MKAIIQKRSLMFNTLLDPNFKLENSRAIITPLSLDHLKILTEIGCHPSIWTYNSRFEIDSEQGMKEYIERALKYKELNERIPYIIYDKLKQRYAGSISFYSINEEYQKIDIGYLWYGVEFQRTGLNQAVMSLMFDLAFNSFKCRRVEFHVNSNNVPSRRSIEKYGAKLDGIIRNDCIRFDGQNIDQCLYSILPEEYLVFREKMHVE